MKAAVYNRFGGPEVLSIEEIPKPQPKDREMLIKVVSTAVTSADSRIRAARFPKGFSPFARLVFGIFKPRNRVLGSCFSGVVETIGHKVTNFKPGDQVCGMNGVRMGAYAEYLVVDASKSVVKKPKHVSHDEAAGLMFGGTAALYFLRDKAKMSKGQKVVINGASGAVGTNGVQLAKYFGAVVTAVAATHSKQLVTSLGATHVIDYKKESLLDSSEKYDIILDTVGNIEPNEGKRILTKDGKLVLMVASLFQMFGSSKQVITGTATEQAADIAFLLTLVEQGKLKVVIDKIYTLEEIVQAHRHADSGSKLGNIIIRVNDKW